MNTILNGITASHISTPRLRAHVLERPASNPRATVVLIHGNVSSALFYQPLMLALEPDVRAIAIDLRGFGGSEILPIDATRGVRDFSDDVASVLDELQTGPVHLVGWSMGGGVVMQFLLDHPEMVASLTLQAPVSPYGFGSTSGSDGVLINGGAGSGGGGANADFVASLQAGDDTADSPTSARAVFRGTYVAPGYESEHEDLWVASMLTTATGDGNYPGTGVPCDAWPGFAPGDSGVLNTMAPTHFNVSGIVDLPTKPHILWIHGDADAIVSDASFFDLNHLGALGAIPGWPGADVAPAQPMISQTRAVLDRYAINGGSYAEVVLEGCGHSPHLEQPERFLQELAAQF
ncbi:MAG: alpha/beta hydrolase [Propionibacteriaceae bacterium]|nr:alpha/beta hydrolase [Propionibacteriaceae bacterium]